jgi:hypothetical protein
MKGMYGIAQDGKTGQRFGTVLVKQDKGDKLVVSFLNPQGKFNIVRVIPLDATTDWLFFESANEMGEFIAIERAQHERDAAIQAAVAQKQEAAAEDPNKERKNGVLN